MKRLSYLLTSFGGLCKSEDCKRLCRVKVKMFVDGLIYASLPLMYIPCHFVLITSDVDVVVVATNAITVNFI